jgi:hypothetical protein
VDLLHLAIVQRRVLRGAGELVELLFVVDVPQRGGSTGGDAVKPTLK